MRFLFVRHGQTDYNATQRIQGHIDIPLNDLGRWQAGQIGQRLRNYQLSAVIASDLARARETARAIAAHHPHLTLRTTTSLREISYGAFEGLQLSEIEERFPEEYPKWRDDRFNYTPPGAESTDEQRIRAEQAIRWVREHCPNGDIVIVTHGGIMRSLIATLLDLDLDQQNRFLFHNTSLSVVDETPRGRALMLANDTSHLGDQSPWP